MECPRCGKEAFSSDGTCLACNYRAGRPETFQEPKSASNDKGASKRGSVTYQAGDPPAPKNQEELPKWRQELTQRLEALKNNRKMDQRDGREKRETASTVRPNTNPDPVVKPAVHSSKHAGSIQFKKQPPKLPGNVSKPQPDTPRQKTNPSFEAQVDSSGDNPERKTIRDLIDEAISGKSISTGGNAPIFASGPADRPEDKSILLSRTLSGLVDLFFVVICTGTFIFAVDFFSGFVLLDTACILEFTVLFLMIFFLYSVFFLATSGQTIGMMITDLRITGVGESRPSIGQLFIRCLGYLLSVGVFGTGLLWGFFDRRNQCFHDRFSNTSIVRV